MPLHQSPGLNASVPQKVLKSFLNASISMEAFLTKSEAQRILGLDLQGANGIIQCLPPQADTMPPVLRWVNHFVHSEEMRCLHSVIWLLKGLTGWT